MTLLIVAALILAGLSVLAFFGPARILCLHLLAFGTFFIVLPVIGALAPVGGRVGSLSGDDLGAALVANSYLYVVYAAGLLPVVWLFSDAQILSRVEATFAAQQMQMKWIIGLYVGLGVDVAFRSAFNLLIIGSGDSDTMQSIPYVWTSFFSLLNTITFGLFCYAALFSRRSKLALFGCLLFIAFYLVSEGRRSFTICVIVLFVLRTATVVFRIAPRYAVLGLVTISAFIYITPIFTEARYTSLGLRSSGVNQVSALVDGMQQVLQQGDTPYRYSAASNIAERGSAGTFFLNVVTGLSELDYGEMIVNSFRWAVPSTFMSKPEIGVEQMLEEQIHAPVVTDDASSPHVFFYADFGTFGMFLAGIYMSLTLYLIAGRLGSGRQYGFFELCLLGVFFYLSCQIELELTAHFTIFRNLLLIWLAVLPFRLMMIFRISPVEARPQRRRRRVTA